MIKLDRAAVQTAVEEMEGDFGFESVLREDYRGKGEEQEGFGLTFPSPNEIQEFFIQLALFDSDIVIELVREAKHDQMGKGYITYFPGWELMVL